MKALSVEGENEALDLTRLEREALFPFELSPTRGERTRAGGCLGAEGALTEVLTVKRE